MAAFWKIAAHSAYDMFFLLEVPNCQFSVFPPRFLEWEFLSDITVSISLPTCIF